MIEPTAQAEPPAWIEALHVAGSIASVTGISLLALSKATGDIPIREILGGLVAASLLLAAGTVMVLILRLGGFALRRRGRAVLAIYWLVAVPLSVILAI